MTAAATSTGPLHGVRVVEVAVGVSDLGLGHAGGVPGRLFADLGATVTRVVGPAVPPIDAEVTWGRVWHRGKEIVAAAGPDEIRRLLLEADVAFVYGSEAMVERRGLGWADIGAAHPGLIYARCRPSRTATGDVGDHALLVEARAGFCTQLAANRDGPMLVDVRANNPLVLAGIAAFVVFVAAIAAVVPARQAARLDPVTALRQD